MKVIRPSTDQYFLSMAELVATRGTCIRRRVGCVLVNERNHVIGTGYNGPPSGEPHCIDTPCPGALLPSGTGLDECEALHAEWNALLQCGNVFEIKTAYVTTSPCIICTKLFLNTSCQRIVFREVYPHSAAQGRWTRTGREWIHLPKE